MDKNRIISFFVLIACLTGNYSFSQQQKKEIKPDQYRAIHWTVKDGLTDDIGNIMIKDAKGFMWIASGQGELCRFDGSVFKKYIPNPQKPNEIHFNEIMGFVEDSLNNIWIGTKFGLSRYDIKADTFSNFTTVVDPVNSNSSAIPFWSTNNEVYCIEAGLRIVVYNVRSRKSKLLLTLDPSEGIHMAGAVVDTATNSLWAGNQKGLVQISLTGGKPKHFSWRCYRNLSNHSHHSEGMQLDPGRNSIWLNSPDGLLEFSMNDKKFRPINAFKEFILLKDYNRWVGIDIDTEGRIWLATQPKGILIYDPKTEQVRQLFSDSVLQKKTGDVNLQILCAQDGIVWSSYWLDRGIYQFLPYNPPVKRYAGNPGVQDSLSNGLIYTIIPAGQGKIWIGTGDGLNIFDPATEKFQVLREKDLPGIKGVTIVPLHVDTVSQKAWLNAGNPDMRNKVYDVYNMDLYEMDLKTRKCRRIIFRDGSKQLNGFVIVHTDIKPYKNGFLAADDNHGVFEIKAGSLFAELVIPYHRQIGNVVLAEEQLLLLVNYAGPPNFSYENKNGKWIKIAHPFDSLRLKSIYYDSRDKTYWISFRYELVHCDNKFRIIKTYGENDGYNRNILRMTTDNSGNLWFVNTIEQVGRLDLGSGKITFLSEADGYYYKDFDWTIPIANDARGNVFIGTGWGRGSKGLDVIHPEKYSSPITSSVYFRTLNIKNNPLSPSLGINNLEELSLRYNQNSLHIETGIIDYHNNGQGHIRYKLEGPGQDEVWQHGPGYYTIRYDGLSPGKYKLTLQASNVSSEFNSPEKTVTIIISPPFWQTWWFRVLAAVFVIAIIYGIIRYRSSSLKKRNIFLEEKVKDRTSELMERTNELNNSLSELRTAQGQLIQSEKMASLGELTSGIAHEIKNPLNFINNFSELNMELITELEEEETKNPDENYRTHIGQIIKTLKKNSEKINHHGKRVDGIVKGMLQHSRLGNTMKELVDLNALCDESLKLAWHGFRAKEKTFNASFETRFDPDLPQVNVFPQDLGRVMINLINNAFYAVHEKKKQNQSLSPDALQTESLYKPSVIVSTKKNGNKIFITVSDNGMGIPPPIMNKIFQPFFTTKPTGEGTGLGLSMSYDIISKSHGGEIKAKSKEGVGTDFEIILPV